MRIRIKLISKCDNKLAVVKLIKYCTDLGLKEAKVIADAMFNYIGLVKEIELREPYLKDGVIFNPLEEFSKIHQYGDFQVTGGLSWERESKMLCLGIGELDDYINFISEYIDYNDLEKNKSILKEILSKLDKEDLVELVNKIKIN